MTQVLLVLFALSVGSLNGRILYKPPNHGLDYGSEPSLFEINSGMDYHESINPSGFHLEGLPINRGGRPKRRPSKPKPKPRPKPRPKPNPKPRPKPRPKTKPKPKPKPGHEPEN